MMRVRKEAMKRKKMDKVNDTEQPSESKNTRSVPSAVKLKQILGTSPSCRMLTPEEIELLRKSKRGNRPSRGRTPCGETRYINAI